MSEEHDDMEEVDYGPLGELPGTWVGDSGQDVSPEPDGSEESDFRETIVFDPIGMTDNAESQELAALRYTRTVERKSNGRIFHNESGFLMWDAERGLVMQALAIPRGVCLMAGGPVRVEGDATVIELRAELDGAEWPIAQSPFMRDNARTVAFDHTLRISAGRLEYKQTTHLEIYDRHFDHTDSNRLLRGPLLAGGPPDDD